MVKKSKLICLVYFLKLIEKLIIIYLGLKQESSYGGKQKIVFYKTKSFKPHPFPTIVLIHGFGADKNHWLSVSSFLNKNFKGFLLAVEISFTVIPQMQLVLMRQTAHFQITILG